MVQYFVEQKSISAARKKKITLPQIKIETKSIITIIIIPMNGATDNGGFELNGIKFSKSNSVHSVPYDVIYKKVKKITVTHLICLISRTMNSAYHETRVIRENQTILICIT